jgi:hypothetical protein
MQVGNANRLYIIPSPVAIPDVLPHTSTAARTTAEAAITAFVVSTTEAANSTASCGPASGHLTDP